MASIAKRDAFREVKCLDVSRIRAKQLELLVRAHASTLQNVVRLISCPLLHDERVKRGCPACRSAPRQCIFQNPHIQLLSAELFRSDTKKQPIQNTKSLHKTLTMPGRGGKGKSSKKGGSKKGESSTRTRELVLKTDDQGKQTSVCDCSSLRRGR